MTASQTLYGWGRWPRRDCATDRLAALPEGAVAPAAPAAPSAIARGLGRSYGDASLNPDLTRKSDGCKRILSFDAETGDIVTEGGVGLHDLLDVFVPRGWFPPVTPGSKFVTVAGMVASDVHGKNHHISGSFGDHVHWLDLHCADGTVRRCSSQDHADLFRATIGGQGLTGHILAVAFRMIAIESAWVTQRTEVAADLDEAIAAFESNLDATYSVAWIDCLARGTSRGRSLVHIGEHATLEELKGEKRRKPFAIPTRRNLTMPMDAPGWALNPLSIRAFNELYYRKGAAATGQQLVDYDSYFYPLDAIREWNRLYGRNGFAQYQCALPLNTARDALDAQLTAISEAGLGSFLAVLKRFGAGAPDRLLSFPMEGYTLALDFPVSPRSLVLMDRLDEITVAARGRLYLAKDSRMTQATFEAGYGPAVDTFRALRKESGADQVFHSLLSRRLNL
ncbi:MAG: FAD-binding oxidoreductase [Pseudomonadota bacterium]